MNAALAFLLLLLWSGPLAAQVRVTSGEHDGFTRIVLQGPALTGWQVTRQPDGYALRLRGAARFDLTRAFDLIGRQRLRGLSPLREGDGLSLAVGCACHALAYDLRPGVVVLDLRDGPPPDGSSFELGADGQRLAPLGALAATTQRPERRPDPASLAPWDWTVQALNPPDPVPLSLPTLPGGEAAALRDALLLQLTRGVADGVVDPVTRLPAPPQSPPESAADGTPNITLRLGERPQIDARLPRDARPLSATGQDCLADDRMALPDWGDPGLPAHAQLADGMTEVLGEFDRPDPDAAARVIRRHLWAGFGAEARLLADALAPDHPDTPVWRGMARVLDGQPAPDAPFAGMAACDGTVALWAALAQPDADLRAADAQAILRAFSALPPHLRHHLGPPLAHGFLAAGDTARAQTLRNAIARADPTAPAGLLDAELALAQGAPERAAQLAGDLAKGGGPDARAALVALIDARAAQMQPVTAQDLAAMAAWHTESPDPETTRALMLAHALAGDFDGAFALAGDDPADLWPLLATLGPDSALLSWAVLPAATAATATAPVAPDMRHRIAERLTDLGLGAAALRWLGPQGDPLLAARAELARGDPAGALRRLGPDRGPQADRLRAEALVAQGNPTAAATLLSGLDADAERAARLRARQWQDLGPDAPDAWLTAAGSLGAPAVPAGPLARSRALAEESAATRATIAALLDETAMPDAPALTESQPLAP